ncbi:class I lanthipeptide [Chitinophaga varians]|uniref:class I lanthipeptide n=1 Tax=Chitinophaga varians TaxID=2202339 RepID=UPI00165EEACB|nr:class I lanthipeptide [Chitinophaga varians]MBC9909901.1 class I lanthipeptide [Chitinophaga varians]
MKKKAIKKLALSKINIASLNAAGQAKIHGGLRTTTTGDTVITIDGPNDTVETRCLICPDYNTRRC